MSAQFDRDPDVDQAIEDLEPFLFRMRQAQDLLRGSPLLDDVARYKRDIQDYRSLLRERAARIGVDPNGLNALVSLYARLRKDLKRKPSRAQMQRAIWASKDDSEERETEAHRALTEAQLEVKLATQHAAAARQAAAAYMPTRKAA